MSYDTVDATVGRFTVSVIRDDQYIGYTLRSGIEWDGWMRKDLPWLYAPGTDLIDVGGNIGWNALMFSDYGPVHTFEPVYHSLLRHNVAQNRSTLMNPIFTQPYGLSDKAATTLMFVPLHTGSLCNYGNTSLTLTPNHSTTAPIEVQLGRLDDMYTGHPSLIKVDVEGHEFEVLKGAERTIREWHPALYVEIFNYDTSPIPGFLRGLGYSALERPEHNYLFTWSNDS